MAIRSQETQGVTLRTYAYQPFNNGQSIRILSLRPGTGDEALRGELSFASVHNAPAYEALSYVWGDPNRCASIDLGGNPLALTQSLHDALTRLRHPDRPRVLWVDQVCINQADVVERSQQVKFMNEIYKNADHVLVWLGRDPDGIAARAVSFVHELKEVFDDPARSEEFMIANREELHERSEDPWIPLKKLTRLPWVSSAFDTQDHLPGPAWSSTN
jgi:hypothetical protein